MKRLILLAVLFLIPFVSAHLEAGSDDVVNGYLIDFGYSPAHPDTSTSTFINFNFLNATTEESVNPTGVWIRISSENSVVFSSTLSPKNGNVGMLYTFSKPGNYEVLAKFYDGDVVLAEKSYSLDVGGISFLDNFFVIPLVVLAAMIVCLIAIRK